MPTYVQNNSLNFTDGKVEFGLFSVKIPFQVQYGGRVTDDFDKRLLVTFTNVWFCDALLQPGFKFYEGYPLPDHKNIEEYVDHIINMPLQDIPEVFGLHSNADISYQVQPISVDVMPSRNEIQCIHSVC